MYCISKTKKKNFFVKRKRMDLKRAFIIQKKKIEKKVLIYFLKKMFNVFFGERFDCHRCSACGIFLVKFNENHFPSTRRSFEFSVGFSEDGAEGSVGRWLVRPKRTLRWM